MKSHYKFELISADVRRFGKTELIRRRVENSESENIIIIWRKPE